MKTVVVGASPNPSRFSFKAFEKLIRTGFDAVPLSIKPGSINGVEILNIRRRPEINNVDTLTIYVSARNLSEWEDYLISLDPKRIIFNPGAENSSLENKAIKHGIKVVNDCTLVMLSLGAYGQ